MKTTIVIGCIVTICLLVLIPSVPAVEITTIKEVNRTQLITELKTINMQELKRDLQTINKKELKQKVFEALSGYENQSNINQRLLDLIGYILNVIFVIIWWILAIPVIFLFGIWVIVFSIMDYLGLIHYEKI